MLFGLCAGVKKALLSLSWQNKNSELLSVVFNIMLVLISHEFNMLTLV